ncbi:MAG: choice-of-anchor P family protein [Aeromicrobium sp.]
MAADPSFNYFAYAGGTVIRAAGTTISSDLTAQSSISGTVVPRSASNQVASVNVAKLANVGAVETSTKSERLVGGAVRLTSHAKTLGVNLLDGAIKADAVETTNITTGTPAGGLTAVSTTKYVNLKIIGVNLPVNIPENYKVSIPGVATIVLNANIVTTQDGVIFSQGYGLGIWLLQSAGGAPVGSTIVLNPTYAAMAPPVPVNQAQVGGYAYGTHVLVNAGPDISGQVGKTANVSTAPGGSGGKTSTNTTATAKVNGVLTAGTITSTTTSTVTTSSAEVTNTDEVAGVNLFNGVITADVIKTTAHSKRVGTTLTRDTKLSFVNLRVAGKLIPVDVGPNTTINVAGLGKVVINEQATTSNANRVRGIYIKLLEPNGGLQAGAEVEVSVAASWITVAQ